MESRSSVFEKKEVDTYFISGVWVSMGKVAYYAVHEFLNPGVGSAKRFSKAEAIFLVEKPEIKVYVWGWDYKSSRFLVGKQIQVIGGYSGKYLATIPQDDKTKDLKHLINLSWFDRQFY